jgi:hypothetical protein
MVPGSVVLVLALCATLAPASPAAASRSADVAATQALARAAKVLVRAARPDIPRGLAAVGSYANELAAQCPKAAAGSPQNHGAEQLDDEVVGAMTVVGYRTASGPIGVFYHAVKGLHWSNPRLTRAVRTYATKLHELVHLAVPNLCGDVREWAASGYRTLTAGTTEFLVHYNAADPEAEEAPLIMRLAEPYATPADIHLYRQIESFESELGEAEAHAVGYYKNLMNTIELQQ